MKIFVRVMVAVVLLIGAVTVAGYFAMRRDNIPFEVLEAKYASASSRYIDLSNGTRIHYRDQGNVAGHTLLLIHGQSSSTEAWDLWTQHLNDGFRVISIDLPGHGLTRAPPDYAPSMDVFADLVDEFVRELGVERFTIVGHSMGGHAAWTFAARHPERLSSLVLISSGGLRPPGGSGSLALMGFAVQALAPLMAHIDPTIGLRMSMRASLNEGAVPEAALTRAADLLCAPGHREITLRIQMSRSRQASVEEDEKKLASIRVPTLILWGESDNVAPRKYADLFGRNIVGSEIQTYAGVGHVPQVEAAAETAARLQAFLARHRH